MGFDERLSTFYPQKLLLIFEFWDSFNSCELSFIPCLSLSATPYSCVMDTLLFLREFIRFLTIFSSVLQLVNGETYDGVLLSNKKE